MYHRAAGERLKKDLVIGLVGTAILVAAMVGVFRFEAAQGGSSFSVTFSSSTTELPAVDGATDEGGASEEAVEVATANATAIEFELAWTDDNANSGPDEFNLTVTSPEGESRSVQGSGSPLTLTFEGLNQPPPEARVLGSSAEDARERAGREFATRAGTGVWNVTVRLVAAGDVAQAENPLPLAQDTGNAWTLTPRVTAYAARLADEPSTSA